MGYLDRNTSMPDGQTYEPDALRVSELCDLMIDEPFHFAPPWHEREPWERIADGEYGARLSHLAAEQLHETPILYCTNELYRKTMETRDRTEMDRVRPAALHRLALLPIAEGLTPDGKYLEQIERDVASIAAVNAWNEPTHERAREFFNRVDAFTDLTTFHYATNLVAAYHILGDRLSDQARETIRKEIDQRIFVPIERRIRSGKDLYWWFTVHHNWNSVCLASLLTCALTLRQTKEERAWYVAVVEEFIKNSGLGFKTSGFYTEGPTYWGYGFSHYIMASELIRAVTRGRIDMLRNTRAVTVSKFGQRIEIQDGIYPRFADCPPGAAVPAWISHWMNNRIDRSRSRRETDHEIDWLYNFRYRFSTLLCLLMFGQIDPNHSYAGPGTHAQRDWFEDVQFLVCRPSGVAASRVSATFAGGHNGVNHNHNDLGTCTVFIDGHELLVDPGGEVYTTRTFSPRRYDSGLLNSLGHPVPLVAGELQAAGKEAHTRVIRTEFTDELDFVELDLTQAYRVDTLASLQRSFRYTRSNPAAIEIVDTVAFTEDEFFESALITYSDFAIRGNTGFQVYGSNDEKERIALNIHVESEASNLVLGSQIIDESSKPTRLYYRSETPIREGLFRVTIEADT